MPINNLGAGMHFVVDVNDITAEKYENHCKIYIDTLVGKNEKEGLLLFENGLQIPQNLCGTQFGTELLIDSPQQFMLIIEADNSNVFLLPLSEDPSEKIPEATLNNLAALFKDQIFTSTE